MTLQTRKLILSLFLLLGMVWLATAQTEKEKKVLLEEQQQEQQQLQQDNPATTEFTEEQKENLREFMDFYKANRKTLEENRNSFLQSRIYTELRDAIGQAKAILAKGPDSLVIKAESDRFIDYHEIAAMGLGNVDSTRVHTYSNLAISKTLFEEILVKAQKRLEQLKAYRSDLENVMLHIDSLSNDDIIFKVPTNKEEETSFYTNSFLLLNDVENVEQVCHDNIVQINELTAIVSLIVFDSDAKLDQIIKKQEELWNTEDSTLIRVNTKIGFLKTNTFPFKKSFDFSKSKIGLVLEIFLVNHRGIFWVFLGILLFMGIYLRMLKKSYDHVVSDLEQKTAFMLLKRPLLTAVFISLISIQFFYLHFPSAIYSFSWVFGMILLLIIYYNELQPQEKWWLSGLTLAMILAYMDNMMLAPYHKERYLIAFMNAGVCALSLYGFFKISGLGNFKMKFIKVNFLVSILLELISFYGNLSNNYNLAKKMMVAGVLVVVIFLLIIILVRFLYQIFNVSYEVYKESDEGTFNINTEKLISELPYSLYALSLVLAGFIFLNFFYFFQSMYTPFLKIFSEERSIGNFTFTFSSILIFISIIYVSILLSKLLSFLLGDSYLIKQRLKKSKHKGFGNSLLLFKIAIIVLGVLLAFASTGIPIDRITIIISAFSVGIGFGLQTLVNNLISGVIIAIEKPINVGDVIEVSGKMGTMKSIGVRSSMMTTWDGSDVVIPNGDLLNQHLVNWTLGSSRARFDVDVGVAYGSDLEMVYTAVIEMLREHKEVMRYPVPAVFFKEFGGSSIDVSIRFWVRDFENGLKVKSDVIIAIDKLFKEKGIEIPFPQQDVYIKEAALIKKDGESDVT
ncbi:mechanosensitive ion channel domain-containing protein [Robertkochia solimangrovi]|uniref:mechanosensitive ion channel domain-containing protein n=1 Tax=Robertkochia solimangrovi TaxID=2213046 RepID=UPI00117E04EC|nr:mechanosensitive ion channel domain-containing protein [Robertkochia solimangrovi]TRZ41892.1 hypothetical protein DMZ48_16235 [Robertkochia solimangrovi]